MRSPASILRQVLIGLPLSMPDRLKSIVRYSVISVWIFFTASLIVWWLIFALRQLETIKTLDVARASQLAAQHRMLILEGATLLVCVVGSGAALLYSAYREVHLNRRLKLFFLTFAHEIKTPLASLRLQAESLMDDLRNSSTQKLLERLVADANRLSMRIENSLFLTSLDNPVLCYEEIKLSHLLDSCRQQWPLMEIELKGDALLRADQRALEAIFNNLIQNTQVHGRAAQVLVNVNQQEPRLVRLTVSDRGAGCQKANAAFGKLSSRPLPQSGSGLGLFLCRELVNRMGGKFQVLNADCGFAVEFTLRGELA